MTFALWCGPLYHLSDKSFLSEADEIWSAASREAGRHRKKLQGAVIPRGDTIITYTPARTFGAYCMYSAVLFLTQTKADNCSKFTFFILQFLF